MRVLYKKQIFEQYKEIDIDHGKTFSEILDEVNFPVPVREFTEIRIHGHLMSSDVWDFARPNADTTVSIAIVPRGGGGDSNELLKTAVLIAVTVYTSGATSHLGASSGFYVAAASMATGLALNSMFPPPELSLTSEPDRTSVDSITGQSNRADPYGVVIRNYGLNRVYPRVAAEPFTYYVGNDQYFMAIYDFGLGEQNIQSESLLIGESSADGFAGFVSNKANYPSELEIYKNTTHLEQFSVALENAGDSSIRTSPVNVSSVDLKFDFPSGLTTIYASSRRRRETTIRLEVKVKPTSSTIWQSFTNYDYEIDSKYNVDWDFYFEVDLIPDSVTVDQYGNYDPTNEPNGPIIRVRAQGSGTIIRFVVDLANYASEDRAIRVGDKIVIPSYSGSNRERTAFITEIISDNGSHNSKPGVVYTCRIDQSMDYDTLIDVNLDTNYNLAVNFTIPKQILSIYGSVKITANTLNAFRFNLKINFFTEDTWDISAYILDITNDYDLTGISYIEPITKFFWTGIIGYTTNTPIVTTDLHTYLEIKVKATDQLSGRIENLSALVYSVLDYYDDVAMVWKRKETNNPAWIFVDILTGGLNQRAISKDRLDIDSIVAWAKYCEENTITFQQNTNGFECNFVLDYTITVKELLSQVCSTGRATMNINNGKYGVLIDEQRTVPVQMFNQRNITSMSVTRDYIETPHAITCSYIDPQSGWQKNEIIAYNDGYDETNSELIETIEMFAVTNVTQAWRQGRYYLAQQELRRNNLNINTDFENLACSRGDLVLFSHDSMKVGGLPARVTGINGNFITLDEPVSDQGGQYIIRSRIRATDTIIDLGVESFSGTHTVEVRDSEGLQYDDLVVFGETDTVTREYIVKSIVYADEYNAGIELIEHAPAIYSADVNPIPLYTSVTQSDPLAGGVYPGAVTDLVASYEINCNSSEKRYIYSVELSWEAPVNNPVDTYEVYLLVNGQQQLVGFTKNKLFLYEASSLNLEVEHEFKVIGVDGAGRKMPLQNATSVTITPENDTTPPADIQEFNANILTETIQLDWRLVDACDIDRYSIRFSPKTQGAIWAQSTVVASTANNQNTVQVPLRTGTYFVKAIDWAGNISTTAAFLKTQVPEVSNIDFISEINAPNWDGVFDETEVIGSKLKLRSTDGDVTYSSAFGNFYFDEVFDLGSVFTARFTSNILAGGYSGTSIMSNWLTMASINPIAGTFTEDDYDVAAYIRTRNDVDVMSNWPTLASVDYLSFGNELTTTPWQRFTNADFTGRIFQLKLQLEGNADQDVSPVVFDANIVANWTDRVISDADIISGTDVTFDNAFVNTPVVQITAQENVSIGDYYLLSNKTPDGFKVQFYNSSDVAINTPKYDWIAKGFGKKYTLEDINF